MPKRTYQPSRNNKCARCYHEYNSCAVRVCPLDGRPSCLYCCNRCEQSYRVSTMYGCQAADKQKEALIAASA